MGEENPQPSAKKDSARLLFDVVIGVILELMSQKLFEKKSDSVLRNKLCDMVLRNRLCDSVLRNNEWYVTRF